VKKVVKLEGKCKNKPNKYGGECGTTVVLESARNIRKGVVRCPNCGGIVDVK
jgi:hypothetical protein